MKFLLLSIIIFLIISSSVFAMVAGRLKFEDGKPISEQIVNFTDNYGNYQSVLTNTKGEFVIHFYKFRKDNIINITICENSIHCPKKIINYTIKKTPEMLGDIILPRCSRDVAIAITYLAIDKNDDKKISISQRHNELLEGDKIRVNILQIENRGDCIIRILKLNPIFVTPIPTHDNVFWLQQLKIGELAPKEKYTIKFHNFSFVRRDDILHADNYYIDSLGKSYVLPSLKLDKLGDWTFKLKVDSPYPLNLNYWLIDNHGSSNGLNVIERYQYELAYNTRQNTIATQELIEDNRKNNFYTILFMIGIAGISILFEWLISRNIEKNLKKNTNTFENIGKEMVGSIKESGESQVKAINKLILKKEKKLK